MQDIIVVSSAGIAVPRERVDYYRWQAQAQRIIRVVYSDKHDERFILIQEAVIIFRHLLFRIGDATPFIIDEQRYIINATQEALARSTLYHDLSPQSQRRLEKILHRLHRAETRYTQAERRLQELRDILGDNPQSGSTAEELADTTTEARKQEKRLNRWRAELDGFANSKSANLTEFVDISEIRKHELWTDDADKFFEAIIEESYGEEDNNRRASPPWQPPPVKNNNPPPVIHVPAAPVGGADSNIDTE